MSAITNSKIDKVPSHTYYSPAVSLSFFDPLISLVKKIAIAIFSLSAVVAGTVCTLVTRGLLHAFPNLTTSDRAVSDPLSLSPPPPPPQAGTIGKLTSTATTLFTSLLFRSSPKSISKFQGQCLSIELIPRSDNCKTFVFKVDEQYGSAKEQANCQEVAHSLFSKIAPQLPPGNLQITLTTAAQTATKENIQADFNAFLRASV